MTASLGNPTVGLGRFIKESLFTVPSHQRDYSWTDEYVREFTKDIEDALASNRETYFCGLMVFTSQSTVKFKVLDGQQRLATTLMIFSAVRNWFAGFSEYSEMRDEVNKYLYTKELGSPLEPRLILTAANNDAFQKYVIDSIPVAEMERALRNNNLNDRSRILVKSAIFVNRHIAIKASSFANTGDAQAYFLSLLMYLTDKVHIVRFVLASDAAAYTIFETLNDRGLVLAPLDLVKNYLFSEAEKFRTGSLSEFEGRWTEMMTLLSSSRADSFMRAFWSSRHGKPEGAKLFTAFKKAYSAPRALYDLSIDMRRDAERYAALFSSNDATWIGYGAAARHSVDALGIIGFSQAYPIILSALEKFTKAEMERLLWLIECVAVRHQLIGRKRAGRVESLGGRAAKEIHDGRVTSARDVLALIRDLYVPDVEFALAFQSYGETSSKKIRYILAGLERQSVLQDSSTLDDELTPHAVTVEHIFPRSPSEEWKSSVEQDKDWDSRLISRIGNLCLLPGINHSLGNKLFAEKREAYKKSRLITTREVGNDTQWGRVEIDERQGHLAELAVRAWRFP